MKGIVITRRTVFGCNTIFFKVDSFFANDQQPITEQIVINNLYKGAFSLVGDKDTLKFWNLSFEDIK